MEQQNPSFYALIPAIVRYNENICPNAKLLYGELTALTNQKGYCYAGNEYFAKLYKVTIKTASRWIGELEKEGFIRRELVYNEKGEIKERKIYTVHDYLENKKDTPPLLKGDPLPKKEEYNNTSLNNTLNINTSMPVDKSTDVEEVIKLYKTINELPNVRGFDKKRKGHINARIEQFGLDGVKEALLKCKESDFLKSKKEDKTVKWYTCDWIFNSTNMLKILEDNYKNKNLNNITNQVVDFEEVF